MLTYPPDPREEGGARQIGLASAFVLLALVLLFLPATQQRAIAGGVRITLLRPFLSAQEAVSRRRVRLIENEALRARVDSLVAILASVSTLAEENNRLRDLMNLSGRAGPSFRPASVVRAGTIGSESMFILDVGSDVGVRRNSAVVTRDGLVGKVREVTGGSAVALDWTHPDFRASAMTQDGSDFGIIEPVRGDFREEDRLLLNGTAFFTNIPNGTLVVTSGLGRVYPRGIPIGVIEGLSEAEGRWRKSYWVRAAVEPGSITHVLVSVNEVVDLPGDLSGVWPADSVLRRLGVELPSSPPDSLGGSGGNGS